MSDYEPKRRRFSGQDEPPPYSQRRGPSSPAPERPAERKPVPQSGRGRDEDRKRGQRLFGGLLGTLSQKSNSAAQKRRADIEKKQQDKLRLQADEYDDLKKRRRERRDTIRRKEKPFYEREAVSLPFPARLSWSCSDMQPDANPTFKHGSYGAFPENANRACFGMW